MSDTLSDMKVTSREFQRDFTRVREAAAAGERVYVTSGDQECVFQLEAAGFHKDSADQRIVATALVHGLRLISDDARIRQWRGVPMLGATSRG